MMPNNKVYDGEDLFRMYCGLGAAATSPKLMAYAKEKYGQSSQMGPLYAMWKWAFRNPEEAYPIWKSYHLERYPASPQPSFEEFARLLLDWGTRNKNIGGSEDNINRFAAKYGLDRPFLAEEDDVIQFTNKKHALYQRLFVVDRKIEDEQAVEAYAFNPDRSLTNHIFRPDEFGIIGRVIVK